jgi:hypothetical protein
MLGWFSAEAASASPPESAECLRIPSHIIRQELDSNKTMETSVLGLVHHTHTAAAELGNDAVVRNRCVDHVPVPLG